MTETQIARMEARAVVQRWATKPEYRDAVIKRNMKIILNPNSTDRAVAAASKIILAAEAQNIADEQHADHTRMDAGRNRVLALLGGDGSTANPLILDGRREAVARISDSKPSSNKPGRKTKKRKSK